MNIKVNKRDPREDLAPLREEIYRDISTGKEVGERIYTLIDRFSWEELAPLATRLREDSFGSKIQMCTIVNAKSGSCDMDCRFCSQSSRSDAAVPHYPLISSEKLEEGLRYSRESGAGHYGIVTSGGKLNSRDIHRLADSIRALGEGSDQSICGSLGRLGYDDLVQLKEAGMSRIHHNLESSPNFYDKICTTQSWDSRFATVKQALALGFEVCSGGLFGLGESWEDRVELALQLKELGVASVPINLFHPQKGTAWENHPLLSAEEALKIIAVYRILLPKATLRVCGGRRKILGDRDRLIFQAGANALMTGHYLTTKGGKPGEDLRMIESLGLEAKR
ncbi:MAG: biotin synthase BioB [Spirochaetales bacterium]|nr:biotin synthase BioB [Spirochaetales bacterium]